MEYDRVDVMCKWGDSEYVLVTITSDLSYTGHERVAWKKIDACIAPLIRAFEFLEVKMKASCCGHGKTEGKIMFNNNGFLRINQ